MNKKGHDKFQRDRIECYNESLRELKNKYSEEFKDNMKKKLRKKGWEIYPK